tara:strand:+ start:1249 stop:1377 length:129 start_codon:yes stop_codon:yes gene_type:complete
VLLDKTPSSVSVLVVNVPFEDKKNYYLGKHLWALSTEVKVIG